MVKTDRSRKNAGGLAAGRLTSVLIGQPTGKWDSMPDVCLTYCLASIVESIRPPAVDDQPASCHRARVCDIVLRGFLHFPQQHLFAGIRAEKIVRYLVKVSRDEIVESFWIFSLLATEQFGTQAKLQRRPHGEFDIRTRQKQIDMHEMNLSQVGPIHGAAQRSRIHQWRVFFAGWTKQAQTAASHYPSGSRQVALREIIGVCVTQQHSTQVWFRIQEQITVRHRALELTNRLCPLV